MRFSRIFLIIFICNISCVNNEEIKVDSFGNKEITTTEIFNADIEETKYYDKNNILYRSEIFDYGLNTHNVKEFYKTGKLKCKYFTNGDGIEGDFHVFYDNRNNSICRTLNFKKNELVSKIEYYENGKTALVYRVKDGSEFIKYFNNDSKNSLNCKHKLKTN